MSPSTPWTEEEMSYTYIARIHIKPEMEANFRQAIADMMEVARHDPGTLDYQVFTLADDPYSYVFYESYVDADARSEEHTSELQSLMRISYAVFSLKQQRANQRPQDVYSDHNLKNTKTHV